MGDRDGADEMFLKARLDSRFHLLDSLHQFLDLNTGGLVQQGDSRPRAGGVSDLHVWMDPPAEMLYTAIGGPLLPPLTAT